MLALAPGIGDVDIVLASELLEAGRTIAAGFVTPDRTADDRLDQPLLPGGRADGDGRRPLRQRTAASRRSRSMRSLTSWSTWRRWRKQSGAMVNAVMLGIIAGCGRLPIPADAFEGAIRADGKAVDSNLKGFRAGLDAAQQASVTVPAAVDASQTVTYGAAPALRALQRHRSPTMPAAARDVVRRGRPPARRLSGRRPMRGSTSNGSAPIRTRRRARAVPAGRLLREVARHLAVRMSYEDVIRVAAGQDRSGADGRASPPRWASSRASRSR